jgi:glutamine amidotransferase
VAVLDYGSGNVHSVCQAIAATGAQAVLTADFDQALHSPALVVPGVGAFASCMAGLQAVTGDELVKQRLQLERPTLGICVGHQVMFAHGLEHGTDTAGIGIFPGTVAALPTRRRPHMGWNQLRGNPHSRFFREDRDFYFVHSYAALRAVDLPLDAIGLWSRHEEVPFLAAVEYQSLLTCQFHPEKSGQAGLALISAWIGQVRG